MAEIVWASRMWKSWKAYKGKQLDSSLETGKGQRELSHLSWQTCNGPLSSPMQSPETEHPPQGLTGEIALLVLENVIVQQRTTRNNQGKRMIPISTSTDIYKYSFKPRTITDWNAIPPEITHREQSSFKKTVMAHLMWLDEVCFSCTHTPVLYVFNQLHQVTQYWRNATQLCRVFP